MTAYDVNYRYLKDIIEEVKDKAFNDMCNYTFAEWDSCGDYQNELLDELLKKLSAIYGEHSKKIGSRSNEELGISINEAFVDFYSKASDFVVSQNQDYFIKKYIKYEFVLLDDDNE
jgi:hypothetical protein